VARWLNRWGFATERNALVRGKHAKRPYEVDVHAQKQIGLIRKRQVNVWAECKNLKKRVNRNHIYNLIMKAKDLREACNSNMEERYPDILMFFSTSGYDSDAIRIANEHNIYLIDTSTNKYQFIGNLQQEDFEELVKSDY